MEQNQRSRYNQILAGFNRSRPNRKMASADHPIYSEGSSTTFLPPTSRNSKPKASALSANSGNESLGTEADVTQLEGKY